MSELETMLNNHVYNSVSVDDAAKEIYDKFIDPVLEYCEYLRTRNEQERAVPFVECEECSGMWCGDCKAKA